MSATSSPAVGATSRKTNSSQSPPQSASMRRAVGGVGNNNDMDGGLADFLGSPAGSSTSGGGRRAGDEADRYGLFTTTGGAAAPGGNSRVAQSRSRYDALFGEEVRASFHVGVFVASVRCCCFIGGLWRCYCSSSTPGKGKYSWPRVELIYSLEGDALWGTKMPRRRSAWSMC